MIEVFEPINGYEGIYSISNLNRVYSHKRFNVRKGRFLSPALDKYGTLKVKLSKDGDCVNYEILNINSFDSLHNDDIIYHHGDHYTRERSL